MRVIGQNEDGYSNNIYLSKLANIARENQLDYITKT